MAKSQAKNNEEDLKRIEKDRLEINAAYDNGFSPNENNEAETNDNKKDAKDSLVNNDLQDRIDRYGFIHNQKLPADLTETEIKRNKIEKLREIKWRSMIKEWDKHYVPSKHKISDKLISRVYKGIPDSMRNLAWYKLLDVESQIKAQSGVYEKMKNLARKYSNELRQIDLDINRTFRNNYAYKKRYCPRQTQLYNVLAAYSIYNTEIGYCQGMSTLVALILMYLADEERTFWALSQLMSNSKYSMHGFFISGFPKLLRYSDKHEMILKTLLPKIHKKFIKCNITPLIYTTKWFLQCFLDALPFSLVLRVWDVYLLKGDIAMLAMSYCILKMHKRTLLQKSFDMDKINEFLNHKLPENFMFDDDQVIEKLEICIEKLLRQKFELGPILEPIPNAELPKIPFGDFKKSDNRQESPTNINKNINNNNNKDRDAFVEQMAKDRLESEKKKREEMRRRKREEKRLKALNQSNDGLETYMVNGGKPIRNISDEDDDDDDEDEDDDDDDSDDDLNPSKLSEYDDDKVDKESMLSNLTRQSSPQHSSQNSSSLDKKSLKKSQQKINHSHLNGSSNLNKNESESKLTNSNSSITNQISDYENLNSSSILNNSNKEKSKKNYQETSIIKNYNYNSSSLDYKPKNQKTELTSRYNYLNTSKELAPEHLAPSISTSAITTGVNNLGIKSNNQIPTSHSYITTTTTTTTAKSTATASIISNPPPVSPSSFLSASPKQSNSNNNITSIRSSLNYHLNNNNLFLSVKNTLNKTGEYVRSPHGIYTRVNVPPTTSNINSNNNNPTSPTNSATTNGGGILFNQRSPTTFRLIRSPATASAMPSSTQLPQSSSTVMISSGGCGSVVCGTSSKPTSPNSPHILSIPSTKRTASLRSIQKQPFLQHKYTQFDLLNGNNNGSNSSSSSIRTNTPTKQQLQNHSLRIASIQQQNQISNGYVSPSSSTSSNYSNMSVISQRPKVNQDRINQLNQQINSLEVSNHRQSVPNQAHTKLKNSNKQDVIEQYDYI